MKQTITKPGKYSILVPIRADYREGLRKVRQIVSWRKHITWVLESYLIREVSQTAIVAHAQRSLMRAKTYVKLQQQSWNHLLHL